MVLKMPDGAWSTGVFKVKDRAEFEAVAEQLFRDSELILAQAYTYTDFDWRVGILNGEVLVRPPLLHVARTLADRRSPPRANRAKAPSIRCRSTKRRRPWCRPR